MQRECSWPEWCLSVFPLLCCRPAGSSARALAEFWLWDLCGNLGRSGNAACWCHQNTHAAVSTKVPQHKPGHCLYLQGEVNPFWHAQPHPQFWSPCSKHEKLLCWGSCCLVKEVKKCPCIICSCSWTIQCRHFQDDAGGHAVLDQDYSVQCKMLVSDTN